MAKATTPKAIPAVDFLAAQPADIPPVCAIFGEDAFLKRHALHRLRDAVLEGDEAEFSSSTFDGDTAEWRDVHEELATVAMFGGGKRLAIVDDADSFVTKYRPQLEDYVAKPRRTGVLVLDLKTFPATTRLYRSIAADGLLINGSAPTGVALTRWLATWARQTHQVELPVASAEVLVDLVGPELGLLDQEVGKLALMTGDGKKITPELVNRAVGSWRTKTTWSMLDAALDGNPREAMMQLDRLLAAGEQPVGILAQVGATLRRMAAATRMIIDGERAGRRISPRQGLEAAGVNAYFLANVERRLRLLGRRRGAKLYQWLLEADLDLKGNSPLPPRLILERLVLRLAAQPEQPSRP
jgi:DNA polymerase-3 subunit delta